MKDFKSYYTPIKTTLVIHPYDRSTEFLKHIYSGIRYKTVITGGQNIDEVNGLIRTHDRVIMLGHGCEMGLFSIGLFPKSKGLVINEETVELLKEKTGNIYIWCHANKYVEKNELKGFYSGMFISEVGEAFYEGFRGVGEEEVVFSNVSFGKIVGRHINESITTMCENVKNEYGLIESDVVRYNNEKLKVL